MLNELVAKHIMGWVDVTGKKHITEFPSFTKGIMGKLYLYTDEIDVRTSGGKPIDFANDLNHCMMVMEKMNELGYVISINQEPPHWDVAIWKDDSKHECVKRMESLGIDEDLNTAILEAALKTEGIEVD